MNNKIYVGVHKTSRLDDGYMGSGKVIRRAIEKHGLENFHKDILEFFGNAEDMYAREKEIVTEEFLLREDVYNLRRGGHGGFDYINSSPSLKINGQRAAGLSAKNNKKGIFSLTDEQKRQNAKKVQLILKSKKKCAFYNDDLRKKSQQKAQSFEAKQKRKETFQHIGHQQGDNNSQFGKMWIYNEKTFESVRILKDEIIPEGWTKGRKMKCN